MPKGNQAESLKINLGAGRKKLEDFVNVDFDPDLNPDVVWDLNQVPYPFENESAEFIEGTQVLEHLQLHVLDFFKECYRILKPEGVLHLDFPNPFWWKNRLRFLFGQFEWNNAWHPYHVKLVKPSLLVQELRHLGFDVSVQDCKGLSKLLFPNSMDLKLYNVVIHARKRN